MRTSLYLLFICMLFASCAPKMKDGFFQTEITAETTHNVPTDLRSYELLFVPPFMADFGRDLGHFKSVMTHTQVNKLLDLAPNDTIDPYEISSALEAAGLEHEYLVLENSIEGGLRSYYRLSLMEPKLNQLLFSARVQLNGHGANDIHGALGNSLIDYLNTNSEKITGESKEELLLPQFYVGYKSLFSLLNPSDSSTMFLGIGLELFGEYRISQPVAFQLGLNTTLYFLDNHQDTSIIRFAAPLHMKWYLTNSFNLHAGPQLSYFPKPETIRSPKGELHEINNFGWDLSMGLGYTWGNSITIDFSYAKAMSETGKRSWSGGFGSDGEPTKFDTFNLGLGFKF